MGKKKLLDESCSDSELGEERVSDYKADFNDDLDHEDQLFADPYGRRARSYLSKEEHIYGVFYEHPKDRIKPKDTLKTTTFYAGVKFTKEETINEFDEDACEKMDIDPPEGVHTKSSRNTAQKSSRFNKDFGAWEKYTDGIGSKLMSKMGYIRGQGLGKNSQGILEAVRTYQRGDRSGLGSGRSAKQDSPIEAVPDKPQRKNRWKRGSKNKDIYQAARDLIENAEYIEVSTEPMKIIDATGKEMVECNDLSQVFYKDEDLPLVEFRHNTRLLANMARNDLVKFSKKIKEQESAVKAIEEHINLISSVDVPDIDKLKGLLKVCYAIKSECDSLISVESELEIRDRLSSSVHELITEYYEEYKKQKMDSFVVGCLGSLLKTRFSFWDISNNQFLFYELLKSLLPLFLLSPNKAPEKVSVFDEVVSETWKMSFFETLIWTIWFPQVRRYLQNEWDVKDPIAAINFWDKWCEDVFQESKVHHISVIPKWLYDHAINTLIIPKINFFLENCVLTPADLSVLHTWIYPWLSHFHDNGDSIIDHASKKVVGSMGKFNINNDSLFKFMCNWSIILKPGIFNSIIRNNVLPKLAQYIRTEVIINPANQDLLPIQNVLIWDKVVPRDLMVNLLEVEFFPKWFKVLEIWLKAPNTNNEILIWLNSWKNLFNDFSKERGIINMFSAAECAIKQVTIDHIDIGKDGLYMPPPTASDENSESFKPQTGKYAGNFLVDDYFNDSTLAEYVETVVSSYNLIFISDPNGEYHKCTGKLLYRLTVASSSKRKYKPLLCYIDDCVMFSRPPNASLYDLWEPVSIEEACGQALEVAFSKES